MRLKFLFSCPLTLDYCLQEKSKDEKPVTDSWMELTKTALGGDPYQSSEDDSLYLVAPGVQKRENTGYYYFPSLLNSHQQLATWTRARAYCSLWLVWPVETRDDVKCFSQLARLP